MRYIPQKVFNVLIVMVMLVVGFEAVAEETRVGLLLAHLAFDEQTGDVAADASPSGNDGKLSGGPRWTAGRIGGALEFDGVDDFVELPSTPDLDGLQNGSFTVSAWFKPADVPPVRGPGDAGHYGIVNKAGWHTGLRYNDDRTFTFDYWLRSENPTEPRWSGAATGDETFAPGRWYHVAGVVDASARTATIFIDGVAKGTSPAWDAGSRARDYGSVTWKIGTAAPGSKAYAYPSKGVIDDVRIYGRALPAAEITDLAKAGGAARGAERP